MRWSACSDSRRSIDRNFNEESGILGAELLNRPGCSLWIVQPPPAGNANTVWIGGTNDKFSLDIRLPQATFLDRSTELIEDVSLCARGPETAARETRSFLWSRASHSRRRHRERDVACACTCGFALLARKAGGKRGSARLRLKRLAPAVLQWHKTETRISAIAHSVRPCKRKKKALLLFLFAFRRRSRRRRSRKMFSAQVHLHASANSRHANHPPVARRGPYSATSPHQSASCLQAARSRPRRQYERDEHIRSHGCPPVEPHCRAWKDVAFQCSLVM